MNDKQQLAAMGAELRLTEEQDKSMAERMPQAGTLQILDDQPLRTEIRINGVKACSADIGGLLDRCLPHTTEQKPLCMAKRIEELEAQVRLMAGLLREAEDSLHIHASNLAMDEYDEDAEYVLEQCREIKDALDGVMVTQPAVPEGWQLVPVEPTKEMREAFHEAHEEWESGDNWRLDCPDHQWRAMLAAAPKPEVK